MEVVGTVHLIEPTQEVGTNGFKKRLIVVKTDGEHPQFIPVDFVKDKCAVLDGFENGQSVKISVNMRGNEYQGKYYLSFQGWKIEKQNSNF
jgi:single-strand DNA-binding protein